MKFGSTRKKHSRILCSRRCIARVVTLVWATCVGILLCLLLSQGGKIVKVEGDIDKTPSMVVANDVRDSKLRRATNASPTVLIPSQLRQEALGKRKEDDDTTTGQIEAAVNQQRSREQQQWLQFRFNFHQNVEDEAKNPSINADTGSKASSFELPHWSGKNMDKVIHEDPDLEQYIEPECRHFDHRVRRPTHGCQVNKDTTIVYCSFQDLRIDTSLITLGAHGGEPLDTVMGQEESNELPVYEKGAFTTPVKPAFDVSADYRTNLHYMEDVLNNMIYPTKKNKGQFETNCIETWKGTTLLISRYEYVNLYHTITDWWNAFSVLPVQEGEQAPPLASESGMRLIFLDAHAQGNLDPVWKTLFGPYSYVSELPKGGICLEEAIMIPPGYHATLFPDSKPIPRRRCPLHQIAKAFEAYVLASYGLTHLKPQKGKVVIIDRQPYVSHPRSKIENFSRMLINLPELLERLRSITGVASVEIVRLEQLSFPEQIRIFKEAHVVVGMHGAGLSHVLFMDKGSYLVEFTADYQDFFIFLTEWKGVEHQLVGLENSTRLTEVDLQQATDLVTKIVSGQPIVG